MNNLIIIASFFSFLFGTSPNRPDIEMTEKHMSSFTKKMRSKGYDVDGSGGAMLNNIEKVNLSFTSRKFADIDEARALIIDTSEEFLREINADEKLRPYLANYPFNHTNLGFSFAFLNERCNMNEDGIAFVMIVKDKVYYEVSKSKTTPLVTVQTETYAEALEKVQSQKAENCAVAEHIESLDSRVTAKR